MGELIGYARCSTVLQDLTAQREALIDLGVNPDRIYPGYLARLPRSVPDARDIGDTLVGPPLGSVRPEEM